MTTNKTNRLIAEFMGGLYGVDTKGRECIDFFNGVTLRNRIRIEHLRYHSSWDWLMPVIQKISEERLIGAQDYKDVCYPRTFGMPYIDGRYMFRFNGFSLHHGTTWIEAAYAAVIEFIEQYNSQSHETV